MCSAGSEDLTHSNTVSTRGDRSIVKGLGFSRG